MSVMSTYEMVRPFLEVLAIGFLVMVVYLGMPSRLKERLADIWKAIGLPLKAFLPWLAIGIVLAPIALWFVIRESPAHKIDREVRWKSVTPPYYTTAHAVEVGNVTVPGHTQQLTFYMWGIP